MKSISTISSVRRVPIFSAICTMLRSLDFDVSMIENVYVAGGIGSGINMKNAVTIGMFPDVEIDIVPLHW